MVFIQIPTLIFIFLTAPSLWALPSWVTPPTNSYLLVEKQLKKKKGDYFKRNVKRAGNQELDLEGFASVSGNLEHFYQIAQNVPQYRNWALAHINTRPNGKNYLIKIVDLKTKPSHPDELTAVFGLDFPFIKTTIEKTFRINSERNQNSSTVYCRNLNPPDHVLSRLNGFITAFNHPKEQGRLWIYFKGNAQLTHWLLYQAIPERVLAGESSERIHTVLDNFSSEELKYPLNRVKSP